MDSATIATRQETNRDVSEILVAFPPQYQAVLSLARILEKAAAKAETSGRAHGGSKLTQKSFVGGSTLVAVAAVMILGSAVATAQTASVPRTPWGEPDLQGVWDFRTLTPMERPDELADKQVLTAEEAAQFQEGRLAELAARDDEVPADIVGNYNQFWFDPGTSIVETNRTSLIVDPPDGRRPALTTAQAQRQAEIEQVRRGLLMHDITPGGWLEDMGRNALQVRCIVGFNSGPPMTPGGYNQNVQLFQTEDYVVLLNEMVHSSRIIPLDGRAHVDQSIRQWTGDSRGYWDGDTLVVETENFLRETGFNQGLTDANLQLTERFTRISPGILRYEARVDDPTVWAQSWTYEIPMQKNDQPLYEYACHEGNYGLYNMLAGARQAEKAAEEAASR